LETQKKKKKEKKRCNLTVWLPLIFFTQIFIKKRKEKESANFYIKKVIGEKKKELKYRLT
jgi:hypothetical protein